MQKGTIPLLIHFTHMAIMTFCVVTAVVFFPCFGFDKAYDYSIIYSNGSYTVVSFIYFMAVMATLFLVFTCSFHSVIYSIIFWYTRCTEPGKIIQSKGIYLTIAALLLIIVYLIGEFFCPNLREDGLSSFPAHFWPIVISIIVVMAVYVLPYAFLKLAYSELSHHRWYKAYNLFFFLQIVVFCLLVIYWFSPLPAMLVKYVNNHYLYYWAK